MRRIILVFMLLIGLASFANANTTGSITLSGLVGEVMNIQVLQTSAAENLTFSTALISPLVVGYVIFTSNIGFEVSVASANNFNFSNGEDNLSYSLYFDGIVVSGNGVVATGTLANGVQKAVSITYPAASINASPGQYSDVLTFVIAAP